MRKLLLGAFVAVWVIGNSGCILPIYSSDKTRRMKQLLNTSENLRMIPEEWERAWLLDMPAHTVRDRVNGGL